MNYANSGIIRVFNSEPEKDLICSDVPDRYQRLKYSRSLLLVHLILFARAFGLLLSDTSENPVYGPLHDLVRWTPIPPDTFWSGLCALAALGGIWGWWTGRRRPTVGTLLLSGSVLAACSGGFIYAAGWVPAFVWGTLACWTLLEVRLATWGK